MSPIGVIGCGKMGKGIVKSLLRQNEQVLVYDLDKQALREAEKIGAIAVEHPAEMWPAIECCITSLPSSQSVSGVLEGENGALAAMPKGSIVIDTSTISVSTTRRLNQRAKQHGLFFYDCPVSGGPAKAATGELTIMVGGDKQQFPKAERFLKKIGKRVFYIGESGAGQVVKLCHNMLVAGTMTLLAEAMITSTQAGVSPRQLAEVIQEGTAHNRTLEVFGENMLTHRYEEVKFLLGHMAKDMELYMQLVTESESVSILGSMVQQLFSAAARQGKSKMDSSAILNIVESLAGKQNE